MKFCDKLILIAVFIIILAVIHYVLPIINKLIDGKEGMVASSRGGVLTDKERSDVVKPSETITNNGSINEQNSGLPDSNNTTTADNNTTTDGNSYHVHYHINSNDPTTMTSANLTHTPTGDASQDITPATSQFSTVSDSNQVPKTSEYTKEYPCRASITGMFTDCGPRPGNIECYSELYGNCANGSKSD
jgi:hypothetical protein